MFINRKNQLAGYGGDIDAGNVYSEYLPYIITEIPSIYASERLNNSLSPAFAPGIPVAVEAPAAVETKAFGTPELIKIGGSILALLVIGSFIYKKGKIKWI